MLIGYARTSTAKQNGGLVAQLALLEKADVDPDNVFHEQVSSVQPRAQLDAAIKSLRKGDQLVVTKLDRLARSLEHAIQVERQRDSIARAKAEGKYKGRVPTARARSTEVLGMMLQGKGLAEVARLIGISRASVYRIIADHKEGFA